MKASDDQSEPREASEEYHFTFLRVGTVWVVLNAIQTVTVFLAMLYFILR